MGNSTEPGFCECGSGERRTKYGESYGCEKCNELNRRYVQLAADHWHTQDLAPEHIDNGGNQLHISNIDDPIQKRFRRTYRDFLGNDDTWADRNRIELDDG